MKEDTLSMDYLHKVFSKLAAICFAQYPIGYVSAQKYTSFNALFKARQGIA